jgi:hypothetical protein
VQLAVEGQRLLDDRLHVRRHPRRGCAQILLQAFVRRTQRRDLAQEALVLLLERA